MSRGSLSAVRRVLAADRPADSLPTAVAAAQEALPHRTVRYSSHLGGGRPNPRIADPMIAGGFFRGSVERSMGSPTQAMC